MSDPQTRFNHLVSAYSGWLFRYAYWLSGNRQIAEDLVQDTFMRAWRFLDSLESDDAAKSWLTTICRRENARRFERKQLDYSDIEMETIPAGKDEFDARPEVLALRNAMRMLSAKYREPLILQVIDGYTIDELAAMFELPRNTVATRLFRARQKLKAILEGEEPGASNELS